MISEILSTEIEAAVSNSANDILLSILNAIDNQMEQTIPDEELEIKLIEYINLKLKYDKKMKKINDLRQIKNSNYNLNDHSEEIDRDHSEEIERINRKLKYLIKYLVEPTLTSDLYEYAIRSNKLKLLS